MVISNVVLAHASLLELERLAQHADKYAAPRRCGGISALA